MKRYVKDKNNKSHSVEVYGYDRDTNKAYLLVDNVKFHELKVYYREYRTWDDYMGNTPCGDYVILPLLNGEKHRFYINY